MENFPIFWLRSRGNENSKNLKITDQTKRQNQSNMPMSGFQRKKLLNWMQIFINLSIFIFKKTQKILSKSMKLPQFWKYLHPKALLLLLNKAGFELSFNSSTNFTMGLPSLSIRLVISHLKVQVLSCNLEPVGFQRRTLSNKEIYLYWKSSQLCEIWNARYYERKYPISSNFLSRIPGKWAHKGLCMYTIFRHA